jgi:AcrR family transcriptional regulator
MARPKTIDDRVILKAARELFLTKGAAITTAEVAKRAGVAQGSIFKRYKTKQALFHAALRIDEMPWMGSLSKRAEESLTDALIAVGSEIIAFGRKMLPLVMMSWSNREEFGVRTNGAPSGEIPFRPVQDLKVFFDRQVQAKRVSQRVKTPMLAGTFFGGMVHYAMVELMTGEHPVKEKDFVREFVRLLWEGIAP